MVAVLIKGQRRGLDRKAGTANYGVFSRGRVLAGTRGRGSMLMMDNRGSIVCSARPLTRWGTADAEIKALSAGCWGTHGEL